MTTSMHRLQISLPEWQVQFLIEYARREGVSIAELIRRLVQLEVDRMHAKANSDTLWEIAGMAEDHGELIEGIAVSERPELYLVSNPKTPVDK